MLLFIGYLTMSQTENDLHSLFQFNICDEWMLAKWCYYHPVFRGEEPESCVFWLDRGGNTCAPTDSSTPLSSVDDS